MPFENNLLPSLDAAHDVAEGIVSVSSECGRIQVVGLSRKIIQVVYHGRDMWGIAFLPLDEESGIGRVVLRRVDNPMESSFVQRNANQDSACLRVYLKSFVCGLSGYVY